MNGISQQPRVAILGGRNIGLVQARIFQSLGANVCAVLGATEAGAKAAQDTFLKQHGIKAKPFWNLKLLLEEPLDAISICTPMEHHFECIVAAFDRNIPVFCEKPLFWDNTWKSLDIKEKLEVLRNHPNRHLFVNTSNSDLIEACSDQLPQPDDVTTFKVTMHTHGPFQGRDIAVDLMPHGLSLLLNFFGEKTLTDFKIQIDTNECSCHFLYGGCVVEFDFRQDNDRPKELSFSCNDDSFTREQVGNGKSYQLFMRNEKTGMRLEIRDPFETHISHFLYSCKNVADDGFNQASANLKLMSTCLMT